MSEQLVNYATASSNGDLAAVLEAASGIRLDIGCGQNKMPGWIGMDHQALEGVDVVHNWDEFPWPFPNESVLQILASHVVEHVNPVNGHFIDWMNECWRILKPGGRLAIVVPYAGSHGYWQDPTHCNGCNESTWNYFDPDQLDGGLYNFYKPKPWKILTIYWDVAINMEVILEKRQYWVRSFKAPVTS